MLKKKKRGNNNNNNNGNNNIYQRDNYNMRKICNNNMSRSGRKF